MTQDKQHVIWQNSCTCWTYNIGTASRHQVHDTHAEYTAAAFKFVLQLSLQINQTVAFLTSVDSPLEKHR